MNKKIKNFLSNLILMPRSELALSTQVAAHKELGIGGFRVSHEATVRLAGLASLKGSEHARRVAATARKSAQLQGRKTVLVRDLELASLGCAQF